MKVYNIVDEYWNTPNVLHFHGQNINQLANTFRVISTDHIVDSNFDKNKLAIVSTWTEEDHCCLLQQCIKFDIPLINCIPQDYDRTQEWYMPNKIKFFINVLENIDNELVMFLDGYDVLLVHLDDIIERYETQPYDILFGPSCNNYPNIKIDRLWGRTNMGVYRYFNAGCVIGKRISLIEFYKKALGYINKENPWNSEQFIMRYAFSEYSFNKKQTFVGIDFNCKIFRSMGVTDSSVNENTGSIYFSCNRQLKKNIIVTGSDGFIGKELVKELKNDVNNNVLEIDRKSLTEVDYVELLFTLYDIDIVYHLAAQTSVFNTNHAQIIKDNIDCFVKIVDICNKYGTKLVYASSSTANNVNTTSLYGLSKKFNEDYAKLYYPEAVGVRLHNVYDEDHPREGTLMWHVLNDDVIRLYNKGDNRRHFTHVKDAVKGLICAENSKVKLVNCFNPEILTTKEFVNLHNKFNKKVELLDEIRDLDVLEQQVDESIPNILNAEN